MIPGADAAAIAAWTEAIALPLVRGLSHALSNRVGALGAMLEVVLDPDSSARDRATYEIQLRREMAQLGTINKQFRLVAPDRSSAEPLLVDEVTSAATALAVLHRDRRGSELQVRVDGDAAPVKLSRWTLIHTLVAMLDAASASSGRSMLHVTLGGTEREAEIVIGPDEEAVAAASGAAAGNLAAAVAGVRRDAAASREAAVRLAATMAGEIDDVAGGGLRLRVPTLAAVRERTRLPSEPGQ